MKEARYIDEEGKIITVHAKDISAKDYEKTFRGKLYCENSQCSAEVVHQEIQKGGINRFFRTRTGSVHISNCSHAIDYENKRARVSKVGEKVNVSDAHISQSLKDAYNMYLKKLHPDEKTNDDEEKKGQSRKKKNRSSKTTGDIVGTRTIGTAVPIGGEEVEQIKEPYI